MCARFFWGIEKVGQELPDRVRLLEGQGPITQTCFQERWLDLAHSHPLEERYYLAEDDRVLLMGLQVTCNWVGD